MMTELQLTIDSVHILDFLDSAVTYAWFLTGISQEDYRAAVRARVDIILFCPSCSRPHVDPGAESTRRILPSLDRQVILTSLTTN